MLNRSQHFKRAVLFPVIVSQATRLHLEGDQSLKIDKIAGVLTGGDYAQVQSLTLDSIDRGKTLKLSIGTDVVNTSEDWEIQVWDVTNASQLTLSGASTTLPKVKATTDWLFDTIGTTAQVEIRISTPGTDAAAATLIVDEVIVTPDIPGFYKLPDTSEWTSYTPTFTGFGSPTNVEFIYRYSQGTIEIQGRSQAGTVTATTAEVSLPSGFTVSSDVPGTSVVGQYARANAATQGMNVLATADDAFVEFGIQSAVQGGLVVRLGSEMVGGGEAWSFFATIPVNETQPEVIIPDVRTKYQTKTLTADVTTNVVMSDLTFNNLTIGNRYRITLNMAGNAQANSLIRCDIKNGVPIIASAIQAAPGTLSAFNDVSTLIFTASATTLTFTLSNMSGAGDVVQGNSSTQETYAQLEELPLHLETTDWT